MPTIRIPLIVLVLSMVMATWAVAGEESPAKLYQEGLALQKAGKLEQALKLYDRCLKLDPENYLALKASALAYYALGDYSKAAKRVRRLLSFYPGDTTGTVYLAYCNLQLGKAEEAGNSLLLILAKQPKNVAAMIGLAWSQYLQGNRLVALDQLKKALALQPNNKKLQTMVDRIQASIPQFLKDKEAARRYQLMSDLNNAIAQASVLAAQRRGILKARQASQAPEEMRKLMVMGEILGGGGEPDRRGSRAVRGRAGKDDFNRR